MAELLFAASHLQTGEDTRLQLPAATVFASREVIELSTCPDSQDELFIDHRGACATTEPPHESARCEQIVAARQLLKWVVNRL